jgi:glycosyltransferase involved in cell wall biosynthesis
LIKLLESELPVLMQVHEMESLMRIQAGSELPAAVLSQATRFIACSNATRSNLIERHGIPPERVETVHESIPVGNVRPVRGRAEILQELGIPEDALVVVGCGTAEFRKGTDLFVQLAHIVSRRRPQAYFVWVGGLAEQISEFERDGELAGLGERLRFTGFVGTPANYMAAADVFALPSREDPYPLVCLEAASLSKPVVCFEGGGGMPEFVESDCGFVVPYLDVAAMAERTVCLLDSPDCRLKMGQAARRKVVERHDVSVAGPRIAEIIERTIAGT